MHPHNFTPGLYHMPPELMMHNSASMQYLQMHPMATTTIAQMQAAHQASILHQNVHQATVQMHQASQLHQGQMHQSQVHQGQVHQASQLHQGSHQSLARPVCQHHAPRLSYRTP